MKSAPVVIIIAPLCLGSWVFGSSFPECEVSNQQPDLFQSRTTTPLYLRRVLRVATLRYELFPELCSRLSQATRIKSFLSDALGQCRA